MQDCPSCTDLKARVTSPWLSTRHTQSESWTLPGFPCFCFGSILQLYNIIKSPAPVATVCYLCFRVLPHQRVCWVNDGSQSSLKPPRITYITEGSLHSLSFKATARHRKYNLSEKNKLLTKFRPPWSHDPPVTAIRKASKNKRAVKNERKYCFKGGW